MLEYVLVACKRDSFGCSNIIIMLKQYTELQTESTSHYDGLSFCLVDIRTVKPGYRKERKTHLYIINN